MSVSPEEPRPTLRDEIAATVIRGGLLSASYFSPPERDVLSHEIADRVLSLPVVSRALRIAAAVDNAERHLEGVRIGEELCRSPGMVLTSLRRLRAVGVVDPKPEATK